MKTEDGYIINKCLNGDSSAFGLLVDKYKAGVYALAYAKLGNFHDAEDITQEVFIKAYQKLRTLKKSDSFLAWLYSITSNLCKDWYRDNYKRVDGEFIEDQTSQFLDSQSMQSYQNQQLFEKLHNTLESLPETYRLILTLYYLGGMDSPEIAKLLGMSPEAVRQQLSRSRDKLREEMIDAVREAFDKKKLKASFTFRIVEQIGRLKILPAPNTNGLPYGVSLSTSILLLFAFIGNYITFNANTSLTDKAMTIKSGEFYLRLLKMPEGYPNPIKKGKSKLTAKLSRNVSAFTMSASMKSGEWVARNDMPIGRLAFDMIVLNDDIYSIGGLSNGWKPVKSVDIYRPSTKKWLKRPGLPTPRYSLAICSVNGKIYAIGGEKTVGPKVLSAVEEYDPKTNKWTRKADMPTPRGGLSASVVNGKIYAIGGTASDFLTSLSTVEEYDPKTDTWLKRSNMPTARSGLSTEVVDGKIYAVGGQTDLYGQYRGNVTGIVEEYDPKSDTWTQKADMPTARSMLSTSVLNGKILAFGGLSKESPGIPSATVEEYDPKLDVWIKRPDMPTNRFCLATVAVNGKILAMGGLQTITECFKGLSTVEEYIPEK